MISTILIDDESKSRQNLRKLLEKNCPLINIIAEADEVETAVKLIREKNPQLIFMDVEMGDGSGFDLLRQFQPIPFKIIVVTAHLQYAIKAIKFAAVDYLLKPVDVEDLIEAVKKISEENVLDISSNYSVLQNNLEQGSVFKLAITVKDGLIYLDPEEIIRLEADGAYTNIFTATEQYVATKNIKEYEVLLGDESFFRAHNSHLINLKHVKKFIRGDGFFVLLSDGSKVEISRRRKEDFLLVMQVMHRRTF